MASTAKVPSFDKRGFKGFGSFGKVERLDKVPPPTPEKPPDSTPDELDRIKRVIPDETMAKRVFGLSLKFPSGSLPEMIVLDWLRRYKIDHSYQALAFGGRRKRGGLVPDFLLPRGGRGLVLQVQGDYWHSVGLIGLKDADVRMRLVGKWVEGVKIHDVVEVWESDLYHGKHDRTLRMALNGVGMRR